MYGIFYKQNKITDELIIRDLQTVCAHNVVNASRGQRITDYLMVGYTKTYDDAVNIVETGKLLSIIRAAQKEHFDLEVEIDYLTALCAANGIDVDDEEGDNNE